MINLIIGAFWLIGPAYAANAFPPIVRGKKPLDCGKYLKGERILGDGKTIEGTISGVLFGIFYGTVQIIIQPYISVFDELNLITITFPLIIALSTGTVIGDISGSFIKRRFGIKRGKATPPLDQLDFLIVALLFALFVVSIQLEIIIILLILTPIIHWISNLLGYILKVKKEPW